MTKIRYLESKNADYNWESPSTEVVRKYDYEIGRFTSDDPLWEKYTGWTGYQYSLNNPVNYLDRDGLLAEKKNGELLLQNYNDPRIPSSVMYVTTEGKNPRKIEINYCTAGTNCAGYALTGSMNISMETSNGDKVIQDEYHLINSNEIKKDDIVVFYNSKGESKHFGRVTNVNTDNNGNIVDVIYKYTDGKYFNKSEPNEKSVNQGDYKHHKKVYYRKNEGTNKPRKLEDKPTCID